ncbi:MAG: nitroreductase family protein [Porticoccaceae bacterium]|nr:nitroreductase family protein [Porticoccaceae bacterium]
MSCHHLTPDQLLATTRSVRKRLDLTRPVEMQKIEECVHLAMQAPTSSIGQNWQFLVVRDAEKKRQIAKWYKKGHEVFLQRQADAVKDTRKDATNRRTLGSISYLSDHLQDVPVLLIPCLRGRLNNSEVASDIAYQATMYASVIPATWNFMLAARARGMGSCWTTLHLHYEREVADILNIPYEQVTQVALIPVAYTLGTEFKPAAPQSAEAVMRVDSW